MKIRHGGCDHEGFTPSVLTAALMCAGVALTDMDAREVYVMLHQGWRVVRQGRMFRMVTE